MDLTKTAQESDKEYIYRICSMKDSIGYWEDVASIINEELGLRYNESTYRKPFQMFKETFEANKSKFVDTNSYVSDMRKERDELQKERYKLYTEKIEYNKWLRENARDELIVEKIESAISNLGKIEVPHYIEKKETEKNFILCFGDEHYGSEFEIRGLRGEILNKYNPEIFEERMWKLLDRVSDIVFDEDISNLNVFSMGDFTDGVLRVGQLMKLRYGIVDGTVRYMEFISNWLNELSKICRVTFHMVNGNHDQCRFFNQPVNSFKDENMGKVVASYIKARLHDNENFEFVENDSKLIFSNISGYNVVGVHGELKNMESAIKELSMTYKTRIDFLIGGHLHHGAYKNVGVNMGVVRVPSLVGIDDFSMSLNKTSCAGATIICLESGIGKTIEYSINLQ